VFTSFLLNLGKTPNPGDFLPEIFWVSQLFYNYIYTYLKFSKVILEFPSVDSVSNESSKHLEETIIDDVQCPLNTSAQEYSKDFQVCSSCILTSILLIWKSYYVQYYQERSNNKSPLHFYFIML